ncbi:MAG: glycosyltransferase, partial [Gemmatimonadales bacterium]
MKVWLLLPAFNEGSNLPPLLRGLTAALDPAGLSYSVLVVDDGSTDDTAAVAGAAGALLPVRVVRHERNRGLAAAITTGLATLLPQADPEDVIVTMDADNTHPAQLIPLMVTEIERGADLVIASRYAPGGREEGVPPLRRLLSRGIGLLMRLRFGLRGVRDYSSGYRAYRVGLLTAAAGRYGDRLIESRGFTVMAELLLKLQPLRPRAAEVPLRLRYDLKRGASKMRLIDTIKGYLGLLLSRPWRGDAAG